ncbi:MAG: hypothetical protein PHF46_03740 [Candidatus Gracilibacteria bacterium]|nr:hypothetical protein [Candidatus Gracilibacteria bacterium]MDD3120493.1 hypothetical protein [Candidatus Gracilibacteria bacterium]MDD4530292.1 hypothetical protein [Candidatus Gracilibacteria bacterium]
MNKIIVCTNDEILLPIKKSGGDVCWDMKIADDTIFEPGKLVTVGTGVKTYMPLGWQCKVYARSSLPVKNGLMLANSVAIFDANFRGEYIMQFYNFTDEVIKFERGTRLTQMEFMPYYVGDGDYGTSEIPSFEIAVDKKTYDNFAEIYPSERGEGRFGSTGKN